MDSNSIKKLISKAEIRLFYLVFFDILTLTYFYYHIRIRIPGSQYHTRYWSQHVSVMFVEPTRDPTAVSRSINYKRYSSRYTLYSTRSDFETFKILLFSPNLFQIYFKLFSKIYSTEVRFGGQ